MKKGLAVLLTLCLLLATGGCGAAGGFEAQVKKGNYLKAVEIYEEKALGNAQQEQKCLSFLREYLEEQWTAYQNGEQKDEDFQAVMSTLYRVDQYLSLIADELLETDWLYEEVSESREAYEKAEQALEEEDYQAAIRQLKQVSDIDNLNYQDAQDALKKAQEDCTTQAIQQAETLAAEEKYLEAAETIETAESLCGETSVTSELADGYYTKGYQAKIDNGVSGNRLDSLRELLTTTIYDGHCDPETLLNYFRQQIIAQAEKLAEEQKWDAMIQLLDNANSASVADYAIYGYFSNDEAYTAYYQQAYTAKFEQKINGYISAGQPEEVILSYQCLTSDSQEAGYTLVSSELLAKISEVEANYLQDIIDRAETAFQSEGYEDALKIIYEGQQVLPSEQTLFDLAEEYKSYIPVYLNDLEPSKSGYYDDDHGDIKTAPDRELDKLGDVTDTKGNSYARALTGGKGGDYYWNDYDLGKKYSKFSGTFALHSAIKEVYEGSASLIIEVDGVRAGAYKLGYYDDPVSITLDITGADTLRIYINTSSVYWGLKKPRTGFLADAYVQK